MIPPAFSDRLFKLLEENGFIDRAIHLPIFWGTAAVCISSNDSASSIQGSTATTNREAFQVVDTEDCFQLTDTPPFWGWVDNPVYFVKISEVPEMWGEIGPKRKGIFEKQSGSEPKREIWSDMERTMIIKTSEGFELTFPSLYGTNRCLAKCSISNIWQVCVNPILEIFESRECMHLVKADPPRALKNGQYLDFGWQNFELEDHCKFQKAGCKGSGSAADTSLRKQNIHSDHRREVERSRFSAPDRLNMEHKMWSTLEDFIEAGKNMEVVPPPTRAEQGPLSFLGAVLPDTSILFTPKGQRGKGGCRRTPLRLGGFGSFGGQVLF